MNNNNENKVDTSNIDKLIKDIDLKIKKLEQEILDGKSKDEQNTIKKEWKNERNASEDNLKSEMERLDEENKKWQENQEKLIPIDDLKKSLNAMLNEQYDEWDKLLKSAIDDLCKGKSAEEKEKIIKTFENINKD